tara:strand:- start:6751 stop:7680 length:930 start_codon:yes stop_codon:yes gene_type:complete
MGSEKSVFIIIVTYNAMLWIEKCLDNCKEYQVIIVDNCSTDGTVAYIKENFPEVRLMLQKKNLGFGQANNIGIRYALDQGADYVFLLNQDAYLQEGCIEKLVAVHKENPSYGVISPVHLNGQGDQLDEKFLLYLHRDEVTNALLLDAFQNNTSSVYPIEFVNAAGWLLSKQALQTVGGFDPIFFHYGEDDNYCQRVHYHGFKIGVVPSAFLFHDRESRPSKKPIYGSDEYFILLERNFKIRFGNINLENLHALNRHREKRNRQAIKAYLKLQFKRAKQLQKEVNLINKILPELEKSRAITKEKGEHYLG